ncbi:MAG: cytochrome c3 family protein [Beijerinckiaceae bacterium]
MRRLAAFFLVLCFAIASAASASAPAAAQDKNASARLAPVIPNGEGDKCVADTPTMRRFHMNFLLHKRDQTVHEGVRTKRFGLDNCLTCHAVKGADGKAVGFEDSKHFCRTCHDYAAVKIDCFECHNSKPPMSPRAAGNLAPADHAALSKYLQEMGR